MLSIQLLRQRFALEWSICFREFPGSERCHHSQRPFRSGIGGGGFMTVRIPPGAPGESSQVYTIDFRETAPPGRGPTHEKHEDDLQARYAGHRCCERSTNLSDDTRICESLPCDVGCNGES